MLALNGGEPLRKKPFPGWPRTSENDKRLLTDAVRSYRNGGNGARSEFESRFAADNDVKHSIAVANGTVSLELIMRAMGIGYGDDVILPPYTFIATLSSVIFCGARPVFADIDPETYNISPEDAEAKITPRTKAIIAVAVAGCPPDLDRLEEIASGHGVRLIIDAAQAVGAIWRDKSVCAYGDAASVSCQNSKNLTSGEGGIITTQSDELYGRICLSLNGGKTGGRYVAAGQDHNISPFQASVLLSQYGALGKDMYLREKNAAYLSGRLKGLPFVSPARCDDRITRHAWHLYLMRLNSSVLEEKGLNRESFVRAVNAEGIPLTAGYAPLYSFPAASSRITEKMIGRRIDISPLPNSEKAGYKEGVWLYQSLLLGSRGDMDDIADAMIKVWEHADEIR